MAKEAAAGSCLGHRACDSGCGLRSFLLAWLSASAPAAAKVTWPIHREAPPFVDQGTEQEILTTGIKVGASTRGLMRVQGRGPPQRAPQPLPAR